MTKTKTKTKTKTGGALFDRAAAPVYFLAGCPSDRFGERAEFSLVALNDLMDKAIEVEEMELRMAQGGKVFLDSGIFNLTNQHAIAHGITMDEALGLAPTDIDGFARLREAYVSTVKKYEDRLWGYVELDQGGAERKRETRAGLEAEGVCPMPVYHPFNDGWDYFDELCEQYDRICVGNVVQANTPTRKRLLSTIWERHRRHPDVWIHLLGMTPSEMVATLPFESCDSSTFVSSLRWGAETTPFATSACKRMTRSDETFSYDRKAEDLTSRKSAVQMLHSGTHHLSRAWNVQVSEAAKLVDSLPPVQEWEPALR